MKSKIKSFLFPSIPKQNLVVWRQKVLGEARTRIFYVVIFFIMLFILSSFKLFHVNIFKIEQSELGANQTPIIKRGELFDRNGEILATNIRTTNLLVNHKDLLSVDETISALKTLFPNLDYAKIREKISEPEGWTTIKDRLTPADEQKILNLGKPGLEFSYSYDRVYPQTNSAAHFIGYVNRDKAGALGMERALNEQLKNGESFKTSIDIRVQSILREELAKAMEYYRGIGAGGLVLDTNSGEVLAMVSIPDFDPNNFNHYPIDVFFNKTTQGSYELGSTMKLFNSAFALDAGAAKLGDKFDATKSLQYGKFTIHDYHAKKAWLSFEEIFIFSSNIGSARVALLLGSERQKQYMKEFNFLDKIVMDFPENNVPLYPKYWKEIETVTASFGHGISISPMQLTTGAVATVYDGQWRKPLFLAASHDHPATVTVKKLLEPKTVEEVRKLMRLNALDGSGKSADIPGYLVGGKTGTAEKPINGRYDRNLMISSFIAAFPINNPRYMVFAMVDEPKPVKGIRPTGGIVAAPIAGSVIKKIAPLLGINPLETNGLTVDQSLKLPIDLDSINEEGRND